MLDVICPCSKCFGITNYCISRGNAGQLLLGSQGRKLNMGYLLFSLEKLPCHAEIVEAELVLYRKCKNDWEMFGNEHYEIQATKNFMNPQFQYTKSRIAYVGEKQVFHIKGEEETLVFNITNVVRQWKNGEIKNRGLTIRCLNEDLIRIFMGIECEELAPFLQIKCKEKPKPPKPLEHHDGEGRKVERCPVELGATAIVLNKEEGVGNGTY